MSSDPLAWETVASEVEYACPGFDVRRDDVVLPDGTDAEFHYLSEPESVVVLPFLSDDEVVCIEEWRQAVGRVSWGLPAGGLEPDDDDLAAAARRELREETGYEAGSVEHLTTVEAANGVADSVHHHFVAHDCHEVGDRDLDFNESIRVSVTDFETLREAVAAGECRDARTVVAVSQYLLGQ